eukprot:gnl/TRDRNA2_/TRDRNA2_177996_c0_seq3.p2 gnl/TRDRNA2_/TRDRNA2_177996_c0~~gnl/TRDRNA2_/TRDRNA2_177996_c0_seq3.p2  ORF type:complete len:114 (-),score=12.07 gnl/TRDRNA2_/TRDRNA2_177996_c0_seq3:732-1040(-)
MVRSALLAPLRCQRSRGVRSVVHDLASLLVEPGQEQVSSAAPLTHAHAREMSARELAHTVWSFAKMRLTHAPLSASIAASARPFVGEFQCQDLAKTAWAFAR